MRSERNQTNLSKFVLVRWACTLRVTEVYNAKCVLMRFVMYQ